MSDAPETTHTTVDLQLIRDGSQVEVLPSDDTTEPPKLEENSEKKKRNKMRGRMNDSPDTQLSKTLSYLLRHGAAKEGLKMRSDGFVKINDLVRDSYRKP